jgi:hypothetical protein
MNIIHTWANVTSKPDYTNKRTIFHMIMSLLCAKRLYDNVHLYTTSEIYEIIKPLDLPYNRINTDLLDNLNYDGPNFAIPKMEVYRHQNTPFLHIDTDTFLFERVQIPENKKLIFAFPDVMLYPRFDHRIENSRFISFYEYYYELFIKIKDCFEADFFKTMPMDFIPNMSIFGGYDLENIKKTYDYLIDFYFTNREILDTDTFRSPQIVEQLLFFPIYNKITEGYLNNWTMFEAHTFLFSDYPSLSIISKSGDDNKFTVHSDVKRIMEIGKSKNPPKNVLSIDVDLKDLRYHNLCGYLHLAEHKIDDYINNIMLDRLKDIHTIQHNGYDHLNVLVEKIKYGNTETEILESQKKLYLNGLGNYYYEKLCEIFPEKERWEDGSNFIKKLL